MLVTLKTLQEDTFTVEIDPTETVKYFKEKIEKVKGNDFPAKNMKLMYAGKFLLDSNRVSDYNVEEKKFVIIVVKKPKPCTVKEEEPESSTDVPSPNDFFNTNGGQRNSTEHNQMRSEQRESLVRHIIELGFTRAEVEAALSASYNNPDRAVEYLINGVLPSSSNDDDSESEARQRDPDHISDSGDAQLLRQISSPASPGSSTMPNQERIMQLFSEAMDECQNQTRAADSLLEADSELISQSFAEMAEADFHRGTAGGTSASPSMPPSDSMPESMPDSSMFSDRMAFDSFSSAFAEQAMSFAGNLMDRDHEAIERLKQLGFSDQKAIEAYFVCERNENAAADYLFSQDFD